MPTDPVSRIQRGLAFLFALPFTACQPLAPMRNLSVVPDDFQRHIETRSDEIYARLRAAGVEFEQRHPAYLQRGGQRFRFGGQMSPLYLDGRRLVVGSSYGTMDAGFQFWLPGAEARSYVHVFRFDGDGLRREFKGRTGAPVWAAYLRGDQLFLALTEGRGYRQITLD